MTPYVGGVRAGQHLAQRRPVPQIDRDAGVAAAACAPPVPPAGGLRVHAGRHAQHPAPQPVAVALGGGHGRLERLADLCLLGAGDHRPEVLGLPDDHHPGQVAEQHVDAPVAGVRGDLPGARVHGGDQHGQHLLEVVAGAGQVARPDLMGRES